MGEDPASLIARAEKKARGGFLSFFTGGPNLDEAVQLYTMAANKYKLAKQFSEASDCFVRAAYMHEKMGDPNGQAQCFVEAANLMKKYSTKDAVQYYNKAVDIYNTSGRFSQSAKLMKGAAELFEGDGDIERATEYYRKAADFFDMDEFGKSQYTACILKYAEYVAKNKRKYEEAIKIFEKEGEKALRNTLIQLSAKEHFLKAGILHLAAGDSISAKIAYEKYDELDPRFGTSREGKLLKGIVDAYDQEDTEAYVAAIQEFDSITRLEGWKVHFLHQIKETMAPPQAGGHYGDPDNVDMT